MCNCPLFRSHSPVQNDAVGTWFKNSYPGTNCEYFTIPTRYDIRCFQLPLTMILHTHQHRKTPQFKSSLRYNQYFLIGRVQQVTITELCSPLCILEEMI